MAKKLKKIIFNIESVKLVVSPLSKDILFQPLLHPTRQDGSGIDIEKEGVPEMRHSSAIFRIKPNGAWPNTIFNVAEFYYVLEGSGSIDIDKKTYPVKKGDVIYVAAYLERSLKNTGKQDLVYLSITDPEWSPEIEVQP